MNKTVLDRFEEIENECKELVNEEPIERLRFFISIMCNYHQDSKSWIDIEQLFDDCTNELERYKDLNNDVFEKTVNIFNEDIDKQKVLRFMIEYFEQLRKK